MTKIHQPQDICDAGDHIPGQIANEDTHTWVLSNLQWWHP